MLFGVSVERSGGETAQVADGCAARVQDEVLRRDEAEGPPAVENGPASGAAQDAPGVARPWLGPPSP